MSSFTRAMGFAFLVWPAFFSQSVAALGGGYEVVWLGGLGGSYYEDLGTASGVNNDGIIVGYSYNASSKKRATLFDPTGAGNNVDLGVLDGLYSSAAAVNELGQIVGDGESPDGSYVEHAALFDPADPANNRDLGMLSGYTYGSYATAISDNGIIVGNAGDYYDMATLFDSTGGGNNLALGTLGGSSSYAYGVNDSGLIVGSAKVNPSSSVSYACLFDSTGSGNNVSLGTAPGGWYSSAHAVSNAGHIVGSTYYSTGDTHATLFDASGLENNLDLGTPDGFDLSSAQAVNNLGQIVGISVVDQYSVSTDDRSATLFDSSGGGNNVDLNHAVAAATMIGGGKRLISAAGINDNGWIVGTAASPYLDGSTKTEAFLLKPTDSPPVGLSFDYHARAYALAEGSIRHEDEMGGFWDEWFSDDDQQVADNAAATAVAAPWAQGITDLTLTSTAEAYSHDGGSCDIMLAALAQGSYMNCTMSPSRAVAELSGTLSVETLAGFPAGTALQLTVECSTLVDCGEVQWSVELLRGAETLAVLTEVNTSCVLDVFAGEELGLSAQLTWEYCWLGMGIEYNRAGLGVTMTCSGEPVPEPSGVVLLLTGAIGFWSFLRSNSSWRRSCQ